VAVVFDFDGVLVDSVAPVTSSINAALREHGFEERDPSALRRLIGPPTFSAFSELLGAPPDSAGVAAVVATYRAHYASVYLTATRVFDGIVAMLEGLTEHMQHRCPHMQHEAAALAVATAKSSDFAQPLLDALGLARFFAVTAAADPLARSDDKFAVLGRALAGLGVSEAAMVGDRSFDMEAARAHGLRAVGVSWGIGSVEELRAAGAEAIADTPAELLALLVGAADGR
jgi:phosphoglycolate phosphatase